MAQGHSVTRTLPGPRHWLLDEVTAVPGWSQTIKELRDQDTTFREACVVLTGSSARDLEQARKDLADRRGGVADSDRLLLPMGFRAFCRALGGLEELPLQAIRPKDFLTPEAERAISALEPWSDALADAWELFLDVGGFPRAVGEHVGDGAVSDGFVQGLWDVVLGDAIRAAPMSEADVAALLDRLAQNLGSPINASRIARDVGLPGHQAALNRIEDLVRAFLAWRCHRIRDGRPNTAAQRKLYFVDPLIAQLAHRRNPELHRPGRREAHPAADRPRPGPSRIAARAGRVRADRQGHVRADRHRRGDRLRRPGPGDPLRVQVHRRQLAQGRPHDESPPRSRRDGHPLAAAHRRPTSRSGRSPPASSPGCWETVERGKPAQLESSGSSAASLISVSASSAAGSESRTTPTPA